MELRQMLLTQNRRPVGIYVGKGAFPHGLFGHGQTGCGYGWLSLNQKDTLWSFLSSCRRKSVTIPPLRVDAKISSIHQVLPNIYFSFLVGTGLWIQGPMLARQVPLSQSFFVLGIFEIDSHGTILLGWLWTMILLISASWVARITGVSYLHPEQARTFYVLATGLCW
jgi:hypothetical protein